MGSVRVRHVHVVLLIGLLFSSIAAAPPPDITMQVEPFFRGHFKFGEWLPLRMTLANDGPALRAELRIEVVDASAQTVYVVPIELPTGARKRVIVYSQPPSFARALRVRLVDISNPGSPRELESQSVELNVELNVNYLVGVMAPRTQFSNALTRLNLKPSFDGTGSRSRNVTALPLSLSDIPDRPEGLRSFDALIISGTDTSELSPEQKRTLQTWVELGGRLIVGGGAGAARTLTGLPDDLVLDFRSGNVTTELQTLPALGKFGEEDVRVEGPFAVTWTSARSGALIEQDNLALLLNKRVGEGNVNYSALDFAASPFDAWAGATRFWEKLLTPDSGYPVGAPIDISPRASRASNAAYALQNLPALELPSIGWLAGLLTIYTLVVGPINYFVLRRIRKLTWGWLTIPALTLIFSTSAFVFAYSARGSDVIINKISILNFSAHTTQPVQTYIGIFSPERTNYTLNLPNRALPSPISLGADPVRQVGSLSSPSAAEIVEGDPVQVRGVQINQWSMQSFQIESALPDGWSIESNIFLDGNRVRGTVVNRTPEIITAAVLVIGNSYARLGDLTPGKNQSIDETLQNPGGPPFPYFIVEEMFNKMGPTGPSREAQMRQQLLSGYFQSYGRPPEPPSQPTLIGWMRASPLDVQIAGARWATQQTSLVIATMQTEYPKGAIRVNPGMFTVRVIDTTGNIGICGSSTQLTLNSGSAILEYQLPKELATMQVTRLSLITQLLTPNSGITVEALDQRSEWLKFDWSTGNQHDFPDPTRFVSASGTVRLRVSMTNNLGGCISFDLDMEGNN